jgi:hypothetical protein
MIADFGSPLCPVLAEVDELGRLIVSDAVTHLPKWLERCREVFARFRECLHAHSACDISGQLGRQLNDAPTRCFCRAGASAGKHERLVAECDTIAAMLAACGNQNVALARDIVFRIENVVALFRFQVAVQVTRRPVNVPLGKPQEGDPTGNPVAHDDREVQDP